MANHVISFAGDDHRSGVNATFIQPFVSFITRTRTTFGMNTEATFDWKTDRWSVPINFTVSQLMKLGPAPIQLGGGVRYWAESPRGGPEGWGYRIQLTFLFPR